MKKVLKQKIIKSLFADDVRLLPYIPYLWQDLWSLGTPLEPLIALLKRQNLSLGDFNVLDLGCGKGEAGVQIARLFGARVHMVDAVPDFIRYAKDRAKKLRIVRCAFSTEDILRTVLRARDYDMAMLCLTDGALGCALETVRMLKGTVKPGGYLVIADTYRNGQKADGGETLDDWLDAFKVENCIILDRYDGEGEGFYNEYDIERDIERIALRAAELKRKYPKKEELFDGYLESLTYCYGNNDAVSTALWLLRAM